MDSCDWKSDKISAEILPYGNHFNIEVVSEVDWNSHLVGLSSQDKLSNVCNPSDKRE